MMPSTRALLNLIKNPQILALIRELDLVSEDEYNANIRAVKYMQDWLIWNHYSELDSFNKNFNKYPRFRAAFGQYLEASFPRPIVYEQGTLFEL